MLRDPTGIGTFPIPGRKESTFLLRTQVPPPPPSLSGGQSREGHHLPGGHQRHKKRKRDEPLLGRVRFSEGGEFREKQAAACKWGGAGKEQKPGKEETCSLQRSFVKEMVLTGLFAFHSFCSCRFIICPAIHLVIEARHFIPIHFIALHRHCVFYKSKVCGNPAQTSLSMPFLPTALAHFLSLCHIWVILVIFKTFS